MSDVSISDNISDKIREYTKFHGEKPTYLILDDEAYSRLRKEVQLFKVVGIKKNYMFYKGVEIVVADKIFHGECIFGLGGSF